MATIEAEFYSHSALDLPVRHFVDFETSGFNEWTHSPLSLGWVVTDRANNVIDEFYEECRPRIMNRKTWDFEAQKVHKLEPKDVKGKQTVRQMMHKLFKFLEGLELERGNLFYHADSHIDYKFLMASLQKDYAEGIFKIYDYLMPYGNVNTMKLFRKMGYKKYGLDSMTREFGIKLNHHNALSDARALKDVFVAMNL